MKIFLFLIIFLCPLVSFPQTEMRMEDKVRINEAVKISQFVSDNIWENWSQTDFVILLVTDSLEYLVNHTNPSVDFTQSYFDSYLNTKVYIRKKVFQNNFLATFPAVNGVSTIVVGTPENTKKSSLDWVITLLHEHFHQYQSNYKDYYSGIDKLDLKDGDETGMWMLNYKFPYEDTSVNDAFNDLKSKLVTAFLKDDEKIFRKKVSQYLKSKQKFRKSLTGKDNSYFEFQLWQEGLARYTEYKVESYLIKDNYNFSDDFIALKDYEPLTENYKKRIKKLMEETEKITLSSNQRGCFYPMGAIEGIILEIYKPNWRKKYFKSLFNTTKLFTGK